LTIAPSGRIAEKSAAAPHGFRRLLQRVVNARLAIADTGNRIAYRLHEAVDQGRLDLQSGCRIDAAGRHETIPLGAKKGLFPLGALLRFLGLRQAARHAVAHILDGGLAGFRVFLQQYFGADFLRHFNFSFGNGFACHWVCLQGNYRRFRRLNPGRMILARGDLVLAGRCVR